MMSFLMSYFGIFTKPYIFKKVKIAPQFFQLIIAALFAPRYSKETAADRPGVLPVQSGGKAV